MRDDTAIHVKNLSKQYAIGGKQERYRTLRQAITDVAAMPVRRVRSAFRREGEFDADGHDAIWAVKDLTFDVKRGDVVGVVGRNGAGKSTLLKILSRITDPTHGLADIHGRVGSLLEVGTGFHPELTGRENIFLNGAILGMRRVEIERKFDAIVDFAEVERFIDTPVKRYSTGMYMRLAFAVAVHLEPEILLVDEVLAVGDVAFQKKCLGRMEAVAQEGRTVLFVSHNMGAVRSLCNRGIVLDDGRIVADGDISDCIRHYYQAIGVTGNGDEESDQSQSTHTRFGLISIAGANGDNKTQQGEPFEASTTLHLSKPTNGFSLFSILEDMHGRQIFHIREESPNLGLKDIAAGAHPIQVKFPSLWLNPGLYSLYFKVLLWGGWGSTRFVSDKYPLDVEGASSSVDCVLNPQIQWCVQ